MERYEHYDYDQLMMVLVSLEEQWVPGTLKYAVHHVIEESPVCRNISLRQPTTSCVRGSYGL